MSDEEIWRPLPPSNGGLARLRHRIEARQAQAFARRGARTFALATLAIVLVAGIGFGEYARSLPQRRFEHALRAAIAQLPSQEPEKGIARELPSSRPDVRILVLATATTSPSPSPSPSR